MKSKRYEEKKHILICNVDDVDPKKWRRRVENKKRTQYLH